MGQRLGIPISGNLINCTGYKFTNIGTFSSAELRAALTDETGTGAAYFAGGALGTPVSGDLSNCTGVTLSKSTASLGADVALNNTATYFAGPTVALGSVGTWFVSGKVTLRDTSGAAGFLCRLTDGTSIIDSGRTDSSAANFYTTMHLSGYITSPAGNLRITVRDLSTTNGVIIFNASGDSKDSTITGFRIG